MSNAKTRQSFMETMLAQAASEPKSSSGIGEFPCGYLTNPDDPDNCEIYTSFEVREIDGDDEDMLASDQIAPAKKIGELIRRCIVAIGPVRDPLELAKMIPKLTETDRITAFFKVRRVTLGDIYPFEAQCPNANCRTVNDEPTVSTYRVNLSSAETRAPHDPRLRSMDVTLPSGRKAVFHAMTGADADRIAKYAEDKATLQHVARLDSVDGKKIPVDPHGVSEDVLLFITAVSFGDRAFLRDAYLLLEGGVDTEVDLTCPLCKRRFKKEMDLQNGFFSRSGKPKSLSKKSSG